MDTTPTIIKADTNLSRSVNWTLSHGALRRASSHGSGKGNVLYYERYPLTTTFTSINVKTTPAEGAIPDGPLSIPGSNMVSFDCARLAVTNAGDEIIGFAGVRAGSRAKVAYDAAFVSRPLGQSTFGAPVAYSTGTFTDSSSLNLGDQLIYSDAHCQQQGGAERDPGARRVWLMHNFGMEQSGSDFVIRGALGWARID